MADHPKGLDGLTPEDVAPPYPKEQYQSEVPVPRVPPMRVSTKYAKCKRPAHKASRDRKRKVKYENAREKEVEADIFNVRVPLGRGRDAVPSQGPAFPKPVFATTHRVAPWIAAGYHYVTSGDGRAIRLLDDGCDLTGQSPTMAFATLISTIRKDNWSREVLDPMAQLMTSLYDRTSSHPTHLHISTGISHGGGGTDPSLIPQSDLHQKLFNWVFNQTCTRRFLGFLSQAMFMHMPQLAQSHVSLKADICKHGGLYDILYGTPFCAVTMKLGPYHMDHKDEAAGMYAIAPFGAFDPTRGGHIVLHEPKVVVQLNPGDVLFLSACVTHETLHVDPQEQRSTLTLYTADTLFQWARCGHRRLGDRLKEDPDEAGPSIKLEPEPELNHASR